MEANEEEKQRQLQLQPQPNPLLRALQDYAATRELPDPRMKYARLLQLHGMLPVMQLSRDPEMSKKYVRLVNRVTGDLMDMQKAYPGLPLDQSLGPCLVLDAAAPSPHQLLKLRKYLTKTNLGMVWLAEVRNSSPVQYVVCKLSRYALFKYYTDNPIEETAVLKALRGHPNIVQVMTEFKAPCDRTFYWSVMEYCSEGDVYSYIEHQSRASPQRFDLRGFGGVHARINGQFTPEAVAGPGGRAVARQLVGRGVYRSVRSTHPEVEWMRVWYHNGCWRLGSQEDVGQDTCMAFVPSEAADPKHIDAKATWRAHVSGNSGDGCANKREFQPAPEVRVGMFSTKEIFRQILQGVLYMHSRGVAHMDLKPDNVLLTRGKDGKLLVRVCDPGMTLRFMDPPAAPAPAARPARHRTQAISMHRGKRGTTKYMSPRVYANDEYYDARLADVWSLGVVLFAMYFLGNPWSTAARTDERFVYLFGDGKIKTVAKRIKDQLDHWKFPHDADLVTMLAQMLCAEDYRFFLDELAQHPWLQLEREAEAPTVIAVAAAGDDDKTNATTEASAGDDDSADGQTEGQRTTPGLQKQPHQHPDSAPAALQAAQAVEASSDADATMKTV